MYGKLLLLLFGNTLSHLYCISI